MSKRFQPFKEFGRSMKKQKLDLSISSRATSGPIAKSAKLPVNRNVLSVEDGINDFWDDDDDDVILLATQVAEAAIAAERAITQSNQKEKNCVNITESEITFSEFGNAVTTSTQQPGSSEIPEPDILSQMFENDEDDLELLAAVQRTDPIEFKKPLLPPTTYKKGTVPQKAINAPNSSTLNEASEDAMEFILSQNTGPESTLPSTQSAARRQLASERQIKFLMEKLDSVKKENSKLSKELTQVKTTMASKEGETSLLRDELRHLKQQAQKLKMEKILSAQNAQNECQLKMDELEKAVQAKEAEVRMKETECSLVKMRYGDDNQRLQKSLCDESIRQQHIRQKESHLSTSSTSNQHRRLARCLMRMPNFDVCAIPAKKFAECSFKQIHPLIYEHSVDKGCSKKQRNIFQLELENMQTKLAQLQLLGVQNLPENYVQQCVDSVSKVLPEFWSYIHSLEFPKNRRTQPYHEYYLTNTKCFARCSDHSRCLQEPCELYDDERCLCLRRYLAAISIICQQVPQLTTSLLDYRHGEYFLLQIIIDSVKKLGFAREICEHFGILEALAVWLNSLLVHVSLVTPTSILEMLADFLKALVFSRPSAWIFKELSFGLMQICRLPTALELLCVNSPKSSFVTDRVRSSYRFSNESCLMQVYCGLIEIAFPLNMCLQLEHFKLLVVICSNHVRFVYHCFQRPPKLIQKLMPIYDEEDGVNNETGNDAPKYASGTNAVTTEKPELNSRANSMAKPNIWPNSGTTTEQQCDKEDLNPRCECYIKLCLSVVTMIFQLLRQWLLHKQEQCTLQVGEISQLSVQLLHIIFCDNYTTSLFRYSEETTKHYLSLIIKWWSDNSKQLHFNAINMQFLQKLQDSHVLPKDITADTSYDNINVDLSEWQNFTNDDVQHLRPPKNSKGAENCARKLNLIEDSSDQNKFFESLKGFAFNFQ